jgi:o-succinylbenzoate synthase
VTVDASVESFAVDLARPLGTAAGTIERREGFLVRIADGDHAGVGEASPLAGWTESREACGRVLDAAAERARDDDIDAALDVLGGAPAARHGFAGALADLRARRAGVPLYRHLAPDGDAVDAVPVNATVGDGPVEETVASAREAVDAGFGCVKVKVGARPVSEDVGRVTAVRDAVGEGVAVRADANGGWTRVQAYEAYRNLAGAAVAYVEQPLASDDLGGLSGLRGDTVGVAVDETLADTPLEAVLTADAADVVVLKPQVLGGLDRTVAAARRARQAGVTPVVTTTVDAVVARTGAVHAAAAVASDAGSIAPCGLATADRLADDLGPDPAPVDDGHVQVPDGPGLGVTEVSP